MNQVSKAKTGLNGQKPNATWIDPQQLRSPAAGNFGTLRRNQYYGPGYSDVDLSFFKNTQIYERLTIQFRAELFNTFNRINYAPPSISFAALANGNLIRQTEARPSPTPLATTTEPPVSEPVNPSTRSLA